MSKSIEPAFLLALSSVDDYTQPAADDEGRSFASFFAEASEDVSLRMTDGG